MKALFALRGDISVLVKLKEQCECEYSSCMDNLYVGDLYVGNSFFFTCYFSLQ